LKLKEYFDNGVIFKELKSCLNNMTVASKIIANPSLDSTLNKSINRFKNIEKRNIEMRQKCKQIPNQFQDYKSKFNDIEKWMNAVDISVQRLLKGLLNDEEFEKEKFIFQVNQYL
jgi:predicted nuclease with TOPRIM domain